MDYALSHTKIHLHIYTQTHTHTQTHKRMHTHTHKLTHSKYSVCRLRYIYLPSPLSSFILLHLPSSSLILRKTLRRTHTLTQRTHKLTQRTHTPTHPHIHTNESTTKDTNPGIKTRRGEEKRHKRYPPTCRRANEHRQFVCVCERESVCLYPLTCTQAKDHHQFV